MKLLFDVDTVDIELYPGPATDRVLKCFKHLQHVPVPMREWDYPFYLDESTPDDLINQLCGFAEQLGIDVDPAQCRQQSYLNDLHRVFEKNYNGKPLWLDFHESIHLCEEIINDRSYFIEQLKIDYRELAGPLISEFDHTFDSQCKVDLTAGEVTMGWAELGKTPYDYWMNKEPNDMTRMCELIKPHVNFRPRLCIPVESVRPKEIIDVDMFSEWWEPRQAAWCQHWNIKSWTLDNILGQIVIGRVTDFDKLLRLLQSKNKLQRVIL
jgi:hypothetical protein